MDARQLFTEHHKPERASVLAVAAKAAIIVAAPLAFLAAFIHFLSK